MIYASSILSILLLGLAQNTEGFHSLPTKLSIHSTSGVSDGLDRLKAVPEWTTGNGIELNNDEFGNPIPMVTVRFINTVSGNDVVAVVEQGSNLLFVGDQAGVKLPRSCRTGLSAHLSITI